MIKTTLKTTAFIAGLLSMSTVATAATFDFVSILTGDQQNPAVATDATGTASLTVDDVAETLTFRLDVTGISTDDLWDTLVAAAVGPIHLHDGDAGANGPVIVPFAFGDDTYSDTANGFSLLVEDYAYADAAATSGTDLTFDAYFERLTSGGSYINVHTDAFNSGEIRGQLAAVPLPASLALSMMALGGLTAMRRTRKA